MKNIWNHHLDSLLEIWWISDRASLNCRLSQSFLGSKMSSKRLAKRKRILQDPNVPKKRTTHGVVCKWSCIFFSVFWGSSSGRTSQVHQEKPSGGVSFSKLWCIATSWSRVYRISWIMQFLRQTPFEDRVVSWFHALPICQLKAKDLAPVTGTNIITSCRVAKHNWNKRADLVTRSPHSRFSIVLPGVLWIFWRLDLTSSNLI